VVVREDIFDDYRQDCFEDDFSTHFQVLRREALPESGRTLYLMRRRASP
jgi:hypothetical protein